MRIGTSTTGTTKQIRGTVTECLFAPLNRQVDFLVRLTTSERPIERPRVRNGCPIQSHDHIARKQPCQTGGRVCSGLSNHGSGGGSHTQGTRLFVVRVFDKRPQKRSILRNDRRLTFSLFHRGLPSKVELGQPAKQTQCQETRENLCPQSNEINGHRKLHRHCVERNSERRKTVRVRHKTLPDRAFVESSVLCHSLENDSCIVGRHLTILIQVQCGILRQ